MALGNSRNSEGSFSTVTKRIFNPPETISSRTSKAFGQAGNIQLPDMQTVLLTLTTTTQSYTLPFHEHVIFDNVGTNLAQISYDNGQTWIDFLEQGKGYAMDGNFFQKAFALRSSFATTFMRIVTW
jgi:hypothetical protein